MAPASTVSQKQRGALSITKHFAKLKDPRREHRRLHHLQDILVIALCAVIANAQDWHQIVTFGEKRLDWLRGFLELPHGIPSHDTFERVFSRIKPRAFQECFRAWVQAISAALPIKHVAIDGKTLRGSGSAKLGALHLVSAWATEQHLSLGQVAVAAKSNEITAIPALLQMLDLNGALVTIDAMGCQKAIASTIRQQGGHYALTVKENQGNLLSDIQQQFIQAMDTNFSGMEHDFYEKRDHGHGRDEYRSYYVIHATDGIRQSEEWEDMTTIGMCYSERTYQGKTTEETRYFIGSKKASARYYGKALRNHWGIENNLHWQLDVTFNEDHNRVSNRSGAENLALLRRLTLTLLKAHPSKKSMAMKRYTASLDPAFLEEILSADGKMQKR